jgi:hypothetical protein
LINCGVIFIRKIETFFFVDLNVFFDTYNISFEDRVKKIFNLKIVKENKKINILITFTLKNIKENMKINVTCVRISTFVMLWDN